MWYKHILTAHIVNIHIYRNLPEGAVIKSLPSLYVGQIKLLQNADTNSSVNIYIQDCKLQMHVVQLIACDLRKSLNAK